MTTHKPTRAQRINKRQDAIWEKAMALRSASVDTARAVTRADKLPESAWEPYKPREHSWESRYETSRRIRETISGTFPSILESAETERREQTNE